MIHPATRCLDNEGDVPALDEVFLNTNCKQAFPLSPRFANCHFITLASPQSAESYIGSFLSRYRQRTKRGNSPRPILVSQAPPHDFSSMGNFPTIRIIPDNEGEVNSLPGMAHSPDTVMYLFPCPKLDVNHATRYHLVLPLANDTNLDEQLAHKLSAFRHYILSFQTSMDWGVVIDQCSSVRGGFSVLATRALVQRASVLMEFRVGITLFLHHSPSTHPPVYPHNMREVTATLICNSHPPEEQTQMCTWCLSQLGPDELEVLDGLFACPNLNCDTRQRSRRGRWSLEKASLAPLRRPNQALPGSFAPDIDTPPKNLRPNAGAAQQRKPEVKSLAKIVADSPAQMKDLGTVCQVRAQPQVPQPGQLSRPEQEKQEHATVFDGLIGDLTVRLGKLEGQLSKLQAGFPPLEQRDAKGQKFVLTHKQWEAFCSKVQKLQVDARTSTDKLEQATALCRQWQLSTEKSIARLDSWVKPLPLRTVESDPGAGPSTPPFNVTSPNPTPPRSNTPTPPDALATGQENPN